MSNAELLIAAMIAALNNATQLATLYQQSQGRDLTNDELDTIADKAMQSNQALANLLNSQQ